MLVKLLKYDIKFGKRSFLTMAAAMVFMAVIVRVFNISFIRDFGVMVIMPLTMIGICTACIVLVYQNFNRNLFLKEGYFTLTLPVKRYKLIISKLITSIMWFNFMLLALVVMMLITFNSNVWNFILNINWISFLQFLVEYTVINLLAINSILALYLLSTASNVSFGGRRLGSLFGTVCFGAFITLEVLFGTKILAPLLGGLALWIVGGDSVSLYLSKSVPEAAYSNVPATVDIASSGLPAQVQVINTSAVLDISLLITLLIFSAIAYTILWYYLKKRVDLQ